MQTSSVISALVAAVAVVYAINPPELEYANSLIDTVNETELLTSTGNLNVFFPAEPAQTGTIPNDDLISFIIQGLTTESSSDGDIYSIITSFDDDDVFHAGVVHVVADEDTTTDDDDTPADALENGIQYAIVSERSESV